MAIRKHELARLSGSVDYANYLLKARTRFEQGQATTVAELRRVYRRAADQVRKDIEALTPGTLRRSHLEALAANLDRRARELNAQVLTATTRGVYLATEAGTSAAQNISARLLKDAWPEVEVARLFAPINERAAMMVLARAGKDGLKLSDRIWRVGEHWRNAIARVVEDGVARGLDARKMAREVQKYLLPGGWTPHKLETRRRLGVPKDVSYEAMRLARTEMNNAFHEASIMANRAAPSYRGVYWRLSESHPEPDACDDLASNMTYGEPGFYPEGKEPPKPHPQCFCYLVPAHEEPDKFADRLRQWIADPQSQPKLENWYNNTARQFLKRPVKHRVASFVPEVRLGFEDVLREKENEIAQRQLEKAYIIDRAGNILLSKEGTADRVAFTPDEMRLFKGAVLTHNHPVETSLSLQDVRLAVRTDLSEIRAVTETYVYSIKPGTQGWPADKDLVDVYTLTEMQVYQEFWEAIRQQRMTKSEASALHHHTIWERAAPLLDMIYRRSGR